MPQSAGGNLEMPHVEAIAEPLPKATEALAVEWLDRWQAADAAEKDELRAANLTAELRAAIKRLDAARRSGVGK